MEAREGRVGGRCAGARRRVRSGGAALAAAAGLGAAIGSVLPAPGHPPAARAAAIGAADTLAVEEWTVPWAGTRPRDPYVGPDGVVWFVGQTGDYLATLDPDGGTFRRFELPPGTGPHNLIVDPAGAVWYAGNRAAHIGRLDPASGDIRRVELPGSAGRDPHTLVFAPTGDIWFTVQGGNAVGLLEVETGETRLIPVPTPRARPYGIVVDAAGRPWFTEFGSHRIGTVDPGSLELEEIVLPRTDARPRRLAVVPDGSVWYVDYAGGWLGRLDPRTHQVEEWPAPAGAASRPYAMAADDRGRVWFVETGPDPNRLVGFDTGDRRVVSVTPIPSGGGTVRHMVFDPASRALWFGTDANTVGRVRLP